VFYAVCKREQAHSIPVSNPSVGQGTGESRDLKTLIGTPIAPTTAEAHRSGDIQHEQKVQLSLLSKLLYEWELGSCGHIPVDMPDIIAWNIRPDFFEFHSLSTERGAILSRKRTVDFPVQLNLQ
jgi:hypothetical protein